MKTSKMIQKISLGEFDTVFSKIYQDINKARKRYIDAITSFIELYGDREADLFSVPGRSEISGNHTDHNHGKVLAAAINFDIIAIASKNNDGKIRIKSKGYKEDVISLDSLEQRHYKYGTSTALVAGICFFFEESGYNYGGFDAYTTSQVLSGSGLSSSAAFEIMVGNILNFFYNDAGLSPISLAKVAQKSENIYFGKPCGLMDQIACAVGGFVNIDFKDPSSPVVNAINKDLSDFGYALCITDTGGNHADLTEDYASVPTEMKSVANYFSVDVLRQVEESAFYQAIPQLRSVCGDRAVLRSIHFFKENQRVDKQVKALEDNDINLFLSLISESGDSSFKYLQNIYTNKNIVEQGLSLALALSDGFISRVHGGGFAGTIQAFIPQNRVTEYKTIINNVFGENSCIELAIRRFGAIKLDIDKLVASGA